MPAWVQVGGFGRELGCAVGVLAGAIQHSTPTLSIFQLWASGVPAINGNSSRQPADSPSASCRHVGLLAGTQTSAKTAG